MGEGRGYGDIFYLHNMIINRKMGGGGVIYLHNVIIEKNVATRRKP